MPSGRSVGWRTRPVEVGVAEAEHPPSEATSHHQDGVAVIPTMTARLPPDRHSAVEQSSAPRDIMLQAATSHNAREPPVNPAGGSHPAGRASAAQAANGAQMSGSACSARGARSGAVGDGDRPGVYASTEGAYSHHFSGEPGRMGTGPTRAARAVELLTVHWSCPLARERLAGW